MGRDKMKYTRSILESEMKDTKVQMRRPKKKIWIILRDLLVVTMPVTKASWESSRIRSNAAELRLVGSFFQSSSTHWISRFLVEICWGMWCFWSQVLALGLTCSLRCPWICISVCSSGLWRVLSFHSGCNRWWIRRYSQSLRWLCQSVRGLVY